jgi:hypothetical protein
VREGLNFDLFALDFLRARVRTPLCVRMREKEFFIKETLNEF